jgi:hypothetical protein
VQSILRTLADLNSSDAARALSQRIGTDERSTARVLAAGLPTLLITLARNVASEHGARSLLDALERDHDGGILDDVLGALRGTPCRLGDAILGHVLGARRSRVEIQIGRQTGLDPAFVSRILAVLAPFVLGAVGRARLAHGWDALDLRRALGTECTLAEDLLPGSVGVFEELLEADAGQEMGDEVPGVGEELLQRLSRS